MPPQSHRSHFQNLLPLCLRPQKPPQSDRHHLQRLPCLKLLRVPPQMLPLLESHHLQRSLCLKLLRVPRSDRGMPPSPWLVIHWPQ